MARIVGRPPSGLSSLEARFGDKKFRQVVSQSELHGEEPVAGPVKDEKPVTRTTRDASKSGGDDKDTEKEPRPRRNANEPTEEAPVQGPMLSGSGEMGAYTQGMWDAFGTGRSDLGAEWGLAPLAWNDVGNDPQLFHDLWEKNNGNQPLLDGSDFEQFQNQQALQVGLGNPMGDHYLDDIGSKVNNAQSVGGTQMTYGDVVQQLYAADPDTLNALGMKDDNGEMFTSILISTTANNYPKHVQNAVRGRLAESSSNYRMATMEGYTGTFMDFIQEDGTAAFLGGL